MLELCLAARKYKNCLNKILLWKSNPRRDVRRIRDIGRSFAAGAPPLAKDSSVVTPPAPAAQQPRRGPPVALPGADVRRHALGDVAHCSLFFFTSLFARVFEQRELRRRYRVRSMYSIQILVI